MFGFWLKFAFGLAVVGYGYYRLFFRDIKDFPRDMRNDRIKRTAISVPFIAFPMALIIAVSIPLYYLEPYKGRVIEAGTDKPIEGAAVLAVYMVDLPSPTGDLTETIDVRETLTNQNGVYEINGAWRIGFRLAPKGEVNIYKPGYSYRAKVYSNFFQVWWHGELGRIFTPEYAEFALQKLENSWEMDKSGMKAGIATSGLPEHMRKTIKYYEQFRKKNYVGE